MQSRGHHKDLADSRKEHNGGVSVVLGQATGQGFELLQEIKREGYDVTMATDGSAPTEVIRQNAPDLIYVKSLEGIAKVTQARKYPKVS